MKTSLGIKEVIENILSELMNYESDTFSTEGSKLTPVEATAVVTLLISNNIQLGDNIDGLELTEALEEVRGER